MTDYNLIYKSGVTFILKNILGRRDLVKPALEVLGFGKKDRVMDVSLEQIYNFFMLVGVKYTNIMDYTCRKCSVGHLSKSLTEQIYSVEQNFKKKPVAFGLKQSRRRKRSNKRKQKTQKKY
jgi:hemerythrin superfamily protein